MYSQMLIKIINVSKSKLYNFLQFSLHFRVINQTTFLKKPIEVKNIKTISVIIFEGIHVNLFNLTNLMLNIFYLEKVTHYDYISCIHNFMPFLLSLLFA